MASAPKLISFDVIDAADVKVAPRGRKVVTDPSLTAAFASLPADKALNLSKLFGNVDQADRPKVGQTIRKNWRAVREDDCRIDFGTDGVPMVRVKVATAAADAE